ncbi:hypothetical protein RUW00_08670 [Bacillus sp. IS1]|nr:MULTISPECIES: hypothetical protein [Bacillus]MDU0075883.1 hypothetical protein [Bacillus sp. IG2]MDU0101348.1 hypothetical protein [Bacillus sp. IS1]MEC2271651.1 hypothetical protein [Bacillus velezensis]MED3678200.1 hypothetical protein [Bacillus velezensis]
MKKKLAAFLNDGKLDWIDVCSTLLACLLRILFVLRLEKRENT